LGLRLAGYAVVTLIVACASQAPLEPLPRVPIPPAAVPLAPPSPVTAALPSATPPAIPPAAPSSLPAVSQGDIGLPGAVSLLAASSSGAWVALCDGTPKAARLVIGSGPGEPIEDVLARDPRGRFLVVARAGKAELIDAVTGTRTDLSELGADLRRPRSDYGEHRALSFDARGQYLAYVRRTPPVSLVVRTLEGGVERSFPIGTGELWRVQLSADARHVTFEALREDSNRNGKLDWPTPEATGEARACEEPALPRFRTFGYQGRGDALTRGVLTLETGTLRDVPELVTALGSALVVREADGSLRLDRGGKRMPLAPASCGGRVLFADAERELLLATCAPPPPPKPKRGRPVPPSGKREVWLFGAGFARNLHAELYETTTDRDAVIGARLVPVYPGSDSGLVDLERRELLMLPSGSRALATVGPQALLWRGNDLFGYDARTMREERLAQGVHKNPDLLRAGDATLLSPFVILGATGPALSSPSPALALTAAGHVLTSGDGGRATNGSGAGVAIEGPLHWVDARLARPDGPPR
jgi:hypothetical protein